MNNHIPIKIQASEARRTFFELLEKVQKQKEPIIIEKKGEPVAIMIRYKPNPKLDASPPRDPKKIKNLLKRIRQLNERIAKSRKGKPQIDAASLVREIREES